MAEGGSVRVARVAREVAETVLPSYRSRYSKHLFTQPALLAILRLMRHEDWTFREAGVWLGEHRGCARRSAWGGCRMTRPSTAACGVSIRTSCRER